MSHIICYFTLCYLVAAAGFHSHPLTDQSTFREDLGISRDESEKEKRLEVITIRSSSITENLGDTLVTVESWTETSKLVITLVGFINFAAKLIQD